MNIGDIELTIINSIDVSQQAKVDEIKSELDSVTVKHEPSVQILTITGFINQELHSQNLNLQEQKNRIRNLRKRQKSENTIDFRQYKGYLLVENVNFIEEGESRIVNQFEIEARYFPWPKYFTQDEP